MIVMVLCQGFLRRHFMHPTVSDLLEVKILQLFLDTSYHDRGSDLQEVRENEVREVATAGAGDGAGAGLFERSVSGRSKCGNERNDVEVVITYNNAVFAETAYGLKRALELLPCSTMCTLKVVVWGDMHHVFDHADYDSTGSGGCPHRIQIAIAPHEETMLFPTYIVLHMEQSWSIIASHVMYKYVLRHARAVWTFSETVRQHLLNLSIGLSEENVHFVPTYSDPEAFITEAELLAMAATPSYSSLIPLESINSKGGGITHNIAETYSHGTSASDVGTDNLDVYSKLSKKYAISFFGSHSERRAAILIPLMQVSPLSRVMSLLVWYLRRVQ
jgi:hypothetical protein